MRTQHEALMGRLGALEEEFRTVAAKTDKATTDVAVLSSRLGGMEQRVTNSEAQLQHVPRNGDLTALDSQVRALQAAMHLSDKASAMQWGKITGIVIGVSTAVSVIISILGLAWKK
jgi:tetrahydromethanopterin S-methyltransferase subunit A